MRGRKTNGRVSRGPAFEMKWWAMTGSNRRPPRCKRGALPAELIAHGGASVILGGAAECKGALESKRRPRDTRPALHDILPPSVDEGF